MSNNSDSSAKQSARKLRASSLAKELGITDAQHCWLVSNHLTGDFRKAKETNVSFEDFKISFNANKIKAKKTSKKSEQSLGDKKAKGQRDVFTHDLPDYLSGKLIPFSSSQWHAICNSLEIQQAYEILSSKLADPSKGVNPLVQARGMVLQLLNGKEAVRYESTASIQSHHLYDKVLAAALKDGYMADIEMKFAEKFGDVRTLPYEQWVDNVYELFEPSTFTSDPTKHDKLLKSVTKVAKKILKKALELYGNTNEEGVPVIDLLFNVNDEMNVGLKPLEIEEAFQKVTKTGNSGWPFFSSKWAQDEKMKEYYIKTAKAIKNGDYDLMSTYFILFKRSQSKGSTPKMRPIEAPTKAEAIYAKSISDPLLNVLREMQEFCGYKGGENVWKHLPEDLVDKTTWISNDYSKFDKTIEELMGYVFLLLILLFPSEKETLLRLWKFYVHGGLITPQGVITGKSHGLFSGCGLTSVIGTLANYISHDYTLTEMYGEFWEDVVFYLGFGDDTALATSEPFDQQLYSTLMADLGLICNPEKQEISHGDKAYFSFLGYYYHREKFFHYGSWELVPTLPMMRVAPGLLWTEYRMNRDSIDLMVDEAKELGVEEEIINDFLSNVTTNSENMAFLAKFSTLSNHLGFKELVSYMDQNMDIPINAQSLVSYDKMMQLFRTNRVSRNLGLVKQADRKSVV